MEKIIEVDGKELKLRTNGYTPVLYSMTFKKDMLKGLSDLVGGFGKISKDMNEADIIENIDTMFLYELLWVNAKTADKKTPPIQKFLESFDSLPILDLTEELLELNMDNLTSKKK